MRIRWHHALLGFALAVAAPPSFADEAEELRRLRDTTINLVNALVEQGVLTRAKADEIIAQANQTAAKASSAAVAPAAGAAAGVVAGAAAQPPPPGEIRVPYVPDTVKQEITDQVKQDVLAQAKTERWGDPNAFPEWLRHFFWYGDLRIRGEADRFPNDNPPNASVAQLQANGVNTNNSTDPVNLIKVRGRLGFTATVGDTITVGLGLASGGVGLGSNVGSDNQTLGNYQAHGSVGFDRAYIAYQPESWLKLTGGILGDPFYRPTTLVWANDVSLQGLIAQVNPTFGPHWSMFSTVGLFPILYNPPTPTTSSPNKWLYAYQLGVDFRATRSLDWGLAAALYDYRNIEGIPNPTIVAAEAGEYNGTAAPYRQTGNTVFDINNLLNLQNGTNNYLYGLASKFHVLNISSSLDYAVGDPIHVMLNADWIRNLGFDQQEIFNRTGDEVDPQTRGWQVATLVGYPDMARKYSWQAWLGYRYAQRDSTVDAFTDQDFHLGGTDAKGYYLGARFAFETNTAIGFRWFVAKQISGIQLAGQDATSSELAYSINVLQLDLTTSF